MNQTPFPEFFEQSPIILGDGAVIERLRRNTDFELDPFIVNSAFIYEQKKRKALETIYRQHLDIGFQYDLPLLLSTPTWRASRERIIAAGYEGKDVNGDNFRFLDALRSSFGVYAQKVVICGLLSCQGDAYNPEEALETNVANEFHTWQAMKLVEEEPETFGQSVAGLHGGLGMKILGGCCGTNHRHIRYLAKYLLTARQIFQSLGEGK